MKTGENSKYSNWTSPFGQKMDRRRLLIFAIVVVGLCVLFLKPLIELGRYAVSDDLYSHIPLIPIIATYLIWIQKEKLWNLEKKQDVRLGLVPLLVGIAAVSSYFFLIQRGKEFVLDDRLFLLIFSFVCCVFSVFLVVFGKVVFKALLFPVLFLLLIVPFPSAVTEWITVFFQHASADASALLFRWSGTPVFREGLVFQLPQLTIQVAEECSGIRSSLVLFVTGLLSGHLFLKSGTCKTIMALVFIPIGIFRNAIRIITISLLTVHVDPGIIYGPLHRRGGPIFFLLSLIPFFLTLILLRKVESKRQTSRQQIM